MTRPRPMRWMRRHPLLGDSILAAILTIALVGALWNAPVESGGHEANALGTVLVCCTAIPIALRRRHPFVVLAVISIAELPIAIIGFQGPGGLCVMIALYTVAAHTNGPRRALALQVFGACAVVLLVAGLVAGRLPVGGFISSIVFLIGAVVLGDNLQRRRAHFAEMAERQEHAERERDLISRQKVADERSRIARELHDVVAHSVSLMIIQAGAARRSIATAPDRAEAALKDLEVTGRQAMDELRRVLGVLRTGESEAGELTPQPSLATVRSLVDSDPSLPITLTEVGTMPADVPSSVGLSLYRVVQEALTNVRKHAGTVKRVTVTITYQPQQVVVQVVDDGRGASVALNADGHGLVGMRERMALCGGTVTSGPKPGGGWQVRAAAPLPTHATADVPPVVSAPQLFEVS